MRPRAVGGLQSMADGAPKSTRCEATLSIEDRCFPILRTLEPKWRRMVVVKGDSGRLSHRRRKHRWQLRGAKQLSELRSAKAPVAAETARDPMANGAAGGEEAKSER